MTELAQPDAGYDIVEGEPPELLGRNLNSAAHLLASATAFYFLAFVFGYFYLRSLNNGHLWHPRHVKPSLTLGTLVTALIVASAVLVRLGVHDQRARRRPHWRLKAALALALGLVAIALQAYEWTAIGFGPTDGGYASIFFGWTASIVLFTLGTLVWLETLLATAIRYRRLPIGGRPPAGHASGDPDRLGHDIADPLALLRAGLEALSFYLAFLAAVGVLTWIVLYLV